jgi:hypothetical protein
MPNLDVATKLTRPSIFSFNGGSSRFFALYGSAGLLPVSALLKDILDWIVDWKDLLDGLWIVILGEEREVKTAVDALRDFER